MPATQLRSPPVRPGPDKGVGNGIKDESDRNCEARQGAGHAEDVGIEEKVKGIEGDADNRLSSRTN